MQAGSAAGWGSRVAGALRHASAAGAVAMLLAACAIGATGGSALGAVPGPGLTLDSFASPTNFSTAASAECVAGELNCDMYRVTVTNAGSQPTSAPIVLGDILPEDVTVKSVQLFWSGRENLDLNGKEENPFCGGKGLSSPVRCEFPLELAPDARLEMYVSVTVNPGAVSGQPNILSVSGGGAPALSSTTADVISDRPPPFGASVFSSYIAGADGQPDSQAGDHPYELTTRIDMQNELRRAPESEFLATSTEDVKDVVVDLPLGFLGSALASAKCTFAQLDSKGAELGYSCPSDTQVGHILTRPESGLDENSPIFNMVPEHGQAAEFGFQDSANNVHVIDTSVVASAAGYVLRATTRDIPQVKLTNITVTFYGDPAAKERERTGNEVITPAAMFTNPSDCSGEPLVTTLYMDSWQHPGSVNADGSPNVQGPGWASSTSQSPAVTGCNMLRFSPEAFTLKPETTAADTPTGADFELKIPQSQAPETLATPPLATASVTLPPGLTVDPSAANGLQACSEAQVGWLGGSATNFTPAAPTCPDASKVGSVELSSPLIDGTLHGSVYIATQYENPFGSLVAGYIVIDDPRTGVIVKIAGNLTPNPQTGQITGVFQENPQLPFSDLKLHFFGGPRGVLATPEGCGTYTTTSNLEPWSAPDSGPNATPSDSFQVNTGCVSGFAPAFTAGTLNPQAGAFSPFTLSFSRQDSEEAPAGLTVSLPTGLLGKIAGVGECSDAQIAAAAVNSGAAEQSSPSCPASSQLGSVQTGAGPGPSPFFVSGKAYLTGPYKGAPYGVAVIVPALAGPFDLGTVVIRQALFIDPNDAHVTDVSDPFPTILKGIPLRIKRVDVTLDRPGFTFNPTSCEPKAVNATVTSIGGVHAAVSSRFQAAGCATLPFKPSFSVSTAGHASKASGASLDVKVTSKGGPQPGGGEANIRSVKVALPKQLPSRLTTLQKACLAAVFEANPASCPKESDVGTATARTPVLANLLTGPAYLVSHGGAAFPDLEIVLQGEGIKLVLDGHTDIKKGITTSTFNTVPDAPISSFELNLPTGPFSVLSAYVAGSDHYNFCGQSLSLPTTITAQNGAVVTQTTKLGVTGCPPSLAITKTAVKGNSVVVTVKLGQQGTVKITGRGLRTTTRRGLKAGTRTITVPLTAVGRAAKRRRGKLKIQASLTVAGRTGTATTTLKA
jgi:hypothetical protein